MDYETCPECGEVLNPTDPELIIKVDDPMNPGMLGMELGQIVTKCQNCGATIDDTKSMAELSEAFPSVMSIIRDARAKRQEMKSGKRPAGPTVSRAKVAEDMKNNNPASVTATVTVPKKTSVPRRRGGNPNG